jgi:hypothetical protein
MPKLQNWRTALRGRDVYTAPECRELVLEGEVYGHPSFPDGSRIATSPIKETVGRKVLTRTGSTYDLGRISYAQRKMLRDRGDLYDPSNPVV